MSRIVIYKINEKKNVLKLYVDIKWKKKKLPKEEVIHEHKEEQMCLTSKLLMWELSSSKQCPEM